jgi:hypothetical protein
MVELNILIYLNLLILNYDINFTNALLFIIYYTSEKSLLCRGRKYEHIDI